jgi:hypothetical protein
VKTSEGTTRSASTGKLAFALMLMALAATLAAALSPSAALAGGGRHHRDSADVTFTKWIVSLPADPTTLAGVEMAGVVGGTWAGAATPG